MLRTLRALTASPSGRAAEFDSHAGTSSRVSANRQAALARRVERTRKVSNPPQDALDQATRKARGLDQSAVMASEASPALGDLCADYQTVTACTLDARRRCTTRVRVRHRWLIRKSRTWPSWAPDGAA